MTTTTQHWIGLILRDELEQLAEHFEGAGPDAPWRGQEIADAIRERIKNHPAIPAAVLQSP